MQSLPGIKAVIKANKGVRNMDCLLFDLAGQYQADTKNRITFALKLYSGSFPTP